jgi:hypothetical protein
MNRRKRSGQAARVVTVAALVVTGLLWARLLVVHPRAEDGGEPSDPQRAQLAQHKLTELSGALNRLSDAAHHGKASATTVQFSAAEINAMLVEDSEVRGALEDARISSPEVRLQPGRVITTATIERRSVAVPITAEGELTARSGILLYASDRVRLAGVPTTGSVRDSIDGRIQEAFRRLEQRTHARVDRVTVGRDRITLYLSSRAE